MAYVTEKSADHAAPRSAERLIGGQAFDDPFAWLEEAEPDVLKWQAAQNGIASDYLRAPPFAQIRTLMANGYIDPFSCYAPIPRGEHWFHRFVPDGHKSAVLSISSSPSHKGRILLDLADHETEHGASLMMEVMPSPDASLVIVTIAVGGGAETRGLVIDVASGAIVSIVPAPMVAFPVWYPDSSRLLFTSIGAKQLPDGTMSAGAAIFEYDVADRRADQLDLDIPHPACWPTISADGRYAIINIDQTCPRPAYIKRIGDDDWQPFLRDAPVKMKGAIMGDHYIGITDVDAPRGRIVKIPLDSPADQGSWTQIVAQSDEKCAALAAYGGGLLLCYFKDAVAGLRLIDDEGNTRQEIALPGSGAIGKSAVQHILSIMDDVTWIDGDQLSFIYSSLDTPPTHCTYRLGDGIALIVGSPPPRTSARIAYRSADNDGMAVPYRIFGKCDGAPKPTIIWAYGGFNVPILPSWQTIAARWVELGGVWVLAHLRGGGEFGDDQWRGGRRENKPNVFGDLFAVARALVAHKVCKQDQLGFLGSSNGGLLAGAAVAFAPELFRAVCAQVPLLDTLAYARDPQSYAIGLADYGDPNDTSDAAFLKDWSPYHNLRAAPRHPAVLLDAGANDTSCPPWHSRKFAAWLQEYGNSPRVLLRVREGAGHNSLSLTDAIDRDAEELTFFARELGLQITG